MTTQVTELKTAGYDHDDPSLKTGVGGLTVWVLQKMAQEQQVEALDKLFNSGLNMNSLPVGLAAGVGVPLLTQNRTIAEALEYLTGRNWKGKVFFGSNDKTVSEGRNRIRESLVRSGSRIVPMAKFVTKLMDSHPLTPDAKSNVVILNYKDPQTRPYWAERLVAMVQVYDVQVAVKGKYGPIYIGKTWLGRYDSKGEFIPSEPTRIIARYFLDFNEGALKEQHEEHWDGSEEDILDPLPHVEN
jgi:hypothetical protein